MSFPDSDFTLSVADGNDEANIYSEESTAVEAFFEGAQNVYQGAPVNFSSSKIVIREYSKHDALKKAGLKEDDFYELIDYKYEQNKDIYTQQDVDRFSSLAYLFSLGLGVKNLSVIKSMSDRGVGFFETYFQISDNDPDEIKIAIDKFSEIIGSYILEDL